MGRADQKPIAPERQEFAGPPSTAREALLAQASALRIQADALEALAGSLPAPGGPQTAEPLNLTQLSKEFGFTRESLASAAGKGLPVHRGARGRLTVFRRDVENWIRSRAWEPTSARRDRQESGDEGAALARAEAELLAGAGCATRRTKGKTAA